MKYKRWPTTKEQHEHMKMREKQNVRIARRNPNENMLIPYLKKTGLRWSRQSQWGYRIFDFWCHTLGVAIEIDGKEHNKKYDIFRDKENYERSGIIVLRVRNKNIGDIKKVMGKLRTIKIWSLRRIKLGLKPLKRDVKEGRVPDAHLPILGELNNAGRSYTIPIPN